MDSSKRAYKCYAADGPVHGFDTKLDLQQALSSGHFTLTEPGRDGPAISENPARNYGQLPAEDLRKLCVARNVVGYMAMTREQQIEALSAKDADEDATLKAAKKAKAAAGKK